MSLNSANLGIMSADEFKNRTKATKAVCGFASKFKSRGSGMAGIDLTLETWQQKCNSNIEPAQKLALVMAIAYECERWLARKSQKSSKLSNFRSQVISDLLKSVKSAMHFLKNKVHSSHGTNRNPTKSLDKNFAFERKNYVDGGKQQNPFSASAVEENTQSLGTMTYDQFIQSGAGIGSRVEFMNRAQRLEHLVSIEDGVFMRQGAPYDCKLDVRQAQGQFDRRILAETFAVDKYGNIYSKPLKGIGEFYFNHSSYCAGKEVIVAGTFITKDGKLLYVSNLSGHYKPTPAHLAWFLVLLGEEDVDLTDVCVTAMDGNGFRNCKAETIIRNARAASDWPHMNQSGALPRVKVSADFYTVSNPQ